MATVKAVRVVPVKVRQQHAAGKRLAAQGLRQPSQTGAGVEDQPAAAVVRHDRNA
jgi:hypothetical protein